MFLQSRGGISHPCFFVELEKEVVKADKWFKEVSSILGRRIASLVKVKVGSFVKDKQVTLRTVKFEIVELYNAGIK